MSENKKSCNHTESVEEDNLFKGAEDVLSGANRETLMSDGGGTGRSDTNDLSDF